MSEVNYQNKVALISSFCDTQEKLDILSKNIDTVKSFNIDVILITPFSLPEDITKKCDYTFITKDNLVLEWPKRSMYAWREYNVNGLIHRMSVTYPDYGFAGLFQVKQLSDIALTMGYDQFYHMIYDINIDDNVIDGFKSNRSCNVYPSKRGTMTWAVGLHFMIFNRENLIKFISHISLDNYLSVRGGDAFAWLHHHQESMGYTIEETPVEDVIFYYENLDFFNMSPIEGLKFFIEKNDEVLSNVKMYFYELEDKELIDLNIDGFPYTYMVKRFRSIDLGFNRLNIKPTKITYKGKEYDLTDIISKIRHSILSIQ